jgi:hypothetical protein
MDRLVIHLHMPKTAGTTVRRIFTHRFPSEVVLNHFNNQQRLETLKRETLAQRARIRYVTGHFGFGLHEYFPQASTYITFLRHPLERILSEFYFIKTFEKPLADTIPVFAGLQEMCHSRSGEITDFVHHLDRHPGFANAQTRWLSGLFGIVETAPYSNVPDSALDAAKENLEKYFRVVGITEAFDDSLCIVGREFGLKARELLYEPKRVNHRKPEWKELSFGTKALLEKHNQLDLELYDFARNLMRRQFESVGPAWHAISRILPFAQRARRTARRFARHH